MSADLEQENARLLDQIEFLEGHLAWYANHKHYYDGQLIVDEGENARFALQVMIETWRALRDASTTQEGT